MANEESKGGPPAELAIDPAQRYDQLGLLGEGGMGEVHACRDRVIGRVIAQKAIRKLPGGRTPRTEAREQFLREARVQGQLEHPVVVPVYDVGRAPDERLFFTMKRVAGQTLGEVIEALRAGDTETTRRFGRHRLLAAFQRVCECIDYAHARGVVHRDLKPANVMFGDFGEVYVLDWGVARMLGRRPPTGWSRWGLPETPSGIGGTPGYMPPEQLAEVAAVDGRADVYALGAILFEILTLEPLHATRNSAELVASTQRGAEARASVRYPDRDVPPELEAICVRATALAPDDRYQTVRELSEDLERFLEGHRDLELRREIAAGHVVEARAQADVALSEEGGSIEARRRALVELGRALALHPESPEATRVLAELLATPPRTVPPEAQAALRDEEIEQSRAAGRLAGWTFLGMGASALVLTQIAEVHGVVVPLLFFLPSLLASALGFYSVRRPSDLSGLSIIVCAGVAMATTSAILGPLVLTPILAIALGIISMNVGRLSRYRPLSLTIACLVVAVPALLEIAGLLPSSYRNVDGSWLIVSKIATVPSDRIYPFGLLVMCIGALIVSSLFVWRMADRMAALRRQLQLHAWHLGHLAPEEARGPTSAPPPARR